MLRALAVLLAASCSKPPDDCVVVRDTPENAMVELSKRYPEDPVKVAQTIEGCVAPTGDECDRIAKVIAAMPDLAPLLAIPKGAMDAVKACRTAPPELRRCLLPSYMLAHGDECRAVMTKSVEQINIQPAPNGTTPVDEQCGFVSIYVGRQGTWLATGRDAKSRCYAPHAAGTPDTAWLEEQLGRARTHPCRPSSSELAGAPELPYRDVIAVMDASVKAGFVDTGLSSPAGLAVPLATANARGAARECPATLIPAEPRPPRPATPATPTTSGIDNLKNAPVVIATTSELTLRVGDKPIVVATLAEARAATKLDALAKALPATKNALLILQADASTPMHVIDLVIDTAKAAGYPNVLFAVKKR